MILQNIQVDSLRGFKTKRTGSKSDDKLLMQEKKIKKLLDKKMDQIQKISHEINFNDLTYHFTSPNLASLNFISFRGPLNIYNEIKNGNI